MKIKNISHATQTFLSPDGNNLIIKPGETFEFPYCPKGFIEIGKDGKEIVKEVEVKATVTENLSPAQIQDVVDKSVSTSARLFKENKKSKE